jgi:formiminotetrahydrofolate cyclodeaminase
MSSKLDLPYLQITYHKYKYKKYDTVIKKTVDNRLKKTDYNVEVIEGIENESEVFKVISEIIIDDLKYKN